MPILRALIILLFFPGGLFLLVLGLVYEWTNRKLLAQLQNRIGPRWFQPLADLIKLLSKEEIVPAGANAPLFAALPVVALAGTLTAALYVPLFGLIPALSFPGDLIVAIYLLALLTLSLGLAGANSISRFTLIGTTRTLTQLFSYEAPFLLALLGPAIAAGSWQINQIAAFGDGRWMLLTQPIGFVIAVIGLMGKLELPPFDAPEAETEIVAGALTEYSGRGLGLFHLAKDVALVVGLTLIAAVYMGGIVNPLDFLLKTLVLLGGITVLQALLTRRRIDQTVGLWWRYGALAALFQTLVTIVM
ncbi:MAG TPA: complex I subunit 1 family protein, partial [Aggregatilineaceae bacterium]|nr:complex I subunit 1 family protein [Aggregatilineaceae bacterium]